MSNILKMEKPGGLLLLLVGCLLLACSDKQVSSSTTNDEPKAETVAINTSPKSKVPILDFNALEPLLHKNNDTTYVVNFWATWCKPCVEELPYFEQLTTTYQGKKVKVLLVSLDFSKQIESKLLPFVAKHKLKSEVLVLVDNDSNTWIPKVSPEWSGAIPATIVYRADKRAFYEQSFHTFSDINDIVKTFLN